MVFDMPLRQTSDYGIARRALATRGDKAERSCGGKIGISLHAVAAVCKQAGIMLRR